MKHAIYGKQWRSNLGDSISSDSQFSSVFLKFEIELELVDYR